MTATDWASAVTCVFACLCLIGWAVYALLNDFVFGPRRDERMRKNQWCSGCDRHDRMLWDMAWTEDHGRFWCSDCRKGK